MKKKITKKKDLPMKDAFICNNNFTLKMVLLFLILYELHKDVSSY